MTRHLLNLLTALSLPAFVVAAALWAMDAASGGVSRQVTWDGRRWELASRDGRFLLDPAPQREWEARRIGDAQRRLQAELARYVELKLEVRREAKAGRIADPAPLLERLNAEQRKTTDELDSMNKTIPWRRNYSVPAAPAVVALAVLPAFHVCVAIRRAGDRRRRLRLGRCSRCGYDLSGNVSGVCPECGTSVPRINA